MLEGGRLQLPIGRTINLVEDSDALAFMVAIRHFGKIVNQVQLQLHKNQLSRFQTPANRKQIHLLITRGFSLNYAD